MHAIGDPVKWAAQLLKTNITCFCSYAKSRFFKDTKTEGKLFVNRKEEWECGEEEERRLGEDEHGSSTFTHIWKCQSGTNLCLQLIYTSKRKKVKGEIFPQKSIHSLLK